MRTIAIVDEGGATPAYYRDYFARVRQEIGAARILVITNGEFTRRGYLAAKDKQTRTADFLAAGADGVVEMPLYSVLLADNVYAFSVTAMLQKLGCADDMLIPFEGGSAELFDAIAGFLFDEPVAYQKKMRQLRAQGVELERVLPEVLEGFVPGAGEFLQKRGNRMAVEYYNTLRRAYFPAKPRLMQVQSPSQPMGTTPAQDAYLLERTRQAFAAKPEPDAIVWARDMYFGSEQTAGCVIGALKGDCGGFEELSHRAKHAGVHAVAVRRHLISCLIGYRKVDSFVSIIYNYIPYIRMLGGSEEMEKLLRERAGTTVLVNDADAACVEDIGKRLLLKIDTNAEKLYTA